MSRNLSLFPTRVISILSLYYKVDGNSSWERIDKLCGAGIISKDSARRLKSVFSSIAKLSVQANESKVVDISHIIAKSNENLKKIAKIIILKQNQ